MSDRHEYRIVVEGELSAQWLDWFPNMTMSVIAGDGGAPTTSLTGPVRDQPALRGLLQRLWDLNCDVVLVQRCSSGGGSHDIRTSPGG